MYHYRNHTRADEYHARELVIGWQIARLYSWGRLLSLDSCVVYSPRGSLGVHHATKHQVLDIYRESRSIYSDHELISTATYVYPGYGYMGSCLDILAYWNTLERNKTNIRVPSTTDGV